MFDRVSSVVILLAILIATYFWLRKKNNKINIDTIFFVFVIKNQILYETYVIQFTLLYLDIHIISSAAVFQSCCGGILKEGNSSICIIHRFLLLCVVMEKSVKGFCSCAFYPFLCKIQDWTFIFSLKESVFKDCFMPSYVKIYWFHPCILTLL